MRKSNRGRKSEKTRTTVGEQEGEGEKREREREREKEMNWWLHISLVVVECARCFSGGSGVGEGVATT